MDLVQSWLCSYALLQIHAAAKAQYRTQKGPQKVPTCYSLHKRQRLQHCRCSLPVIDRHIGTQAHCRLMNVCVPEVRHDELADVLVGHGSPVGRIVVRRHHRLSWKKDISGFFFARCSHLISCVHVLSSFYQGFQVSPRNPPAVASPFSIPLPFPLPIPIPTPIPDVKEAVWSFDGSASKSASQQTNESWSSVGQERRQTMKRRASPLGTRQWRRHAVLLPGWGSDPSDEKKCFLSHSSLITRHSSFITHHQPLALESAPSLRPWAGDGWDPCPPACRPARGT